jgi:CubicO group peptidase (beta-lactamase class C family)
MISRPRVTFTLPGNSAITPQVRNLSVNKTLNNVGTLAPAWDQQDALFATAFSLLREPIEQRAFPAASVAVTHGDGLVALKAFGHFTYDPDSPATTSATLFDLASVTKVVATTAMAMVLYERGRLDLDAPLSQTVPEFLADASGQPDPRRREVRLRMLLAHSSGLPAYKKLFLEAHSRDDLLRAAFRTALSADPGERVEYSDIGFILLAAALERIANESLDAFCRREIFQPLSMIDTTFNPPAGARGKIPPTADDRFFRKKIIQGEVQDENSSVLGGVSGHAGLFSTAQDLTRFAHAMLQGGHPILRRETVSLFTRRESLPTGTSRALGWDTPSVSSQSGKYFGSNSFGHLGYTGTSLWIDPERRLSITLLTNRTWPDCANWAIKQVRPKFHDAVVEALMRTSGLPTGGADAREITSST